MLALPYYKEEWKDIPKCNGCYQISNFLKFKSKQRIVKIGGYERIIKEKYIYPTKLSTGYMFINLGRMRRELVHRLVAEAFVPNPDPEHYTEIDHINTYRDDNWYLNLQWVDKKKQMNNPLTKEHIGVSSKTRTGINATHRKPILQLDKNYNFIREWISAREADKELGISYKAISQNLRGKSKSAGGYIWKYKN